MATLVIDPARTALLAMDLLEMMRQRPLAPYGGPEVFGRAAKLLAGFRLKGGFVVLVRVGFSADGKDRLAPPCDSPMTSSASFHADAYKLVPELNVQPADHIVTKRQWGAFFGTDLDLQLRRRGIQTLVLSGIATAFVVESTAREAYERGYRQIFAEDAMTSSSAEEHQVAVTRIFPRIGLVRSTDDILSALG